VLSHAAWVPNRLIIAIIDTDIRTIAANIE
jgi:hypothetical protein